MEGGSESSWKNELRNLLGEGKVRDDVEVLSLHSSDRWYASHAPDVVVFAESRGDVEVLMRFASERNLPVTPRGAGVGYVGGCVPVQAGIALSLARMTQIREIHIADGIAVVEPGVITGDLQQAAREKGLLYPPDPASLRECSIGGNVATNAGGPRCLKYGVTRHYVLGLEVVLADGTVLVTGGRCHKNKTGLDLIGMFVGSEGVLGIITEITLRLLPHPPCRAMLSAGYATYSAASAAVQAVLQAGYLPSALEIADKFTLQAARNHVGESRIPAGEAHLLLELDGQEASVAGECDQLAALLRSSGAISVDHAVGDEEAERFWEIRRAFSYSLRATGLIKLNEDIVVPRGRLVDLARFTEALQLETGIAIACFGHAGDGNIHVNIMVESMETEEDRRRAETVLGRLFAQVLEWGGVVSGEHGIGLAKKAWFPQALGSGAMEVHRRLKTALDPKGILNPGKFI